MKKMLFLFPLFLLLINCNDIFSPDPLNKENIFVTFSITDTTGVPQTKFSPGEDFILRFKILNESGKTLHYTHSYPIILFAIYLSDSVIATSCDYMAYITPVEKGSLENGESFLDKWKGPNTLGRVEMNETITLEPGQYKARVYHEVFFDEYKLPKAENIEFEVIE
jgi:hypothetical protein